MGKLKALFNKQSRSTIAADKIQELLGKFIISYDGFLANDFAIFLLRR